MKKLTLTLSAAALAITGTGIAVAHNHGGKAKVDADGDGMVDGPTGVNGLPDAVETTPESSIPDFSVIDTDVLETVG